MVPVKKLELFNLFQNKSIMASPVVIFLLVCFLDLVSFALLLPHIDSHAKELGCSHIQLGLVGAVFSGCQMISSPIVGSLSDVRGRKPILMFCIIICSFTYFLLGTTASIYIFLILRAILGAFKQTQFIIRALAADYIQDANKLGVFYGRMMSVGGLGLALGPILSGHIMAAFPKSGFNILCFAIAAIHLINTGLISSLSNISNKNEDESKDASKTPTNNAGAIDTITGTAKGAVNKFYNVDWSKYWDIFLFKLLLSLAMGLFYNSYPLFLKTEHDVSPINLGYIISFQGIIGSISNSLIAVVNKVYKNDRDFSQRMFHIFLVMTLSVIGLAIAPSLNFYIALLIPKAVCFALAKIITLELVTNRSEAGTRGTLTGVSHSIRSATGVLTPIIGGCINEYLGISYSFYFSALFATIGAIISYRTRARSIKEKNK